MGKHAGSNSDTKTSGTGGGKHSSGTVKGGSNGNGKGGSGKGGK